MANDTATQTAQVQAAAGQPPPNAVQPETTEQIVDSFVSRFDSVTRYFNEASQNLLEVYLSLDGAILLGVVVATGIAARLLAAPARSLLNAAWPKNSDKGARRGFNAIDRLVLPILWAIMLWVATAILEQIDMPSQLVRVVASLLNAWIVIRLFSGFVRDPLWSKTFAALAWTIAALNILRLLNPTIALLSSVGISMGGTQLTLYMIIKGGVFAFLLIWLAGVLTAFIQGRVQRSKSLTPSVQTLIGQATRIGLLFLAVILALNVVGVDLTALAVFSGAIGIGIGIGFGLQAIFSNLVAGIILLFEGSVKTGDFVDLADGLTGEVKEIGVRATRVMTNDNIDILVPNSEFINNRVTNWTLREGHCRLRVPFGVAYGTDKQLVQKAALEAAAVVPHELKGPGARSPEVWLTGFGDSSLDFELVVWLDPASVKRPGRVNADYTWALEDAFGKYGIEIPFPQRDLHIRSGQLPIRIDGDDASNPMK